MEIKMDTNNIFSQGRGRHVGINWIIECQIFIKDYIIEVMDKTNVFVESNKKIFENNQKNISKFL